MPDWKEIIKYHKTLLLLLLHFCFLLCQKAKVNYICVSGSAQKTPLEVIRSLLLGICDQRQREALKEKKLNVSSLSMLYLH